jgi:hypothetical protein
MYQPRGIFQTTNLSNTAQPVFTEGRQVVGVIITGGATAEVVIFRAINDTEYFRVNVAIGATVIVEFPWYANGGLELITADAAGDVRVAVFYVSSSF